VYPLPQLGPTKDGPEGPGPEAGHAGDGAVDTALGMDADDAGGGGILGGGGLDAIGLTIDDEAGGGGGRGVGGRSVAVTVTVTA
jgi:hypothetical protein